MEEDVAIFLEVRARDGLAAGMFGVERRGPEHDVLAVESAVALANRHGGLVRVEPDGGEAIGFEIEAGDAGAGGLGAVLIEEGEIGLEKLAVLNHVLLAGAFRGARLAFHGDEGFDDIPIADKLREEFLTGAGGVGGFVLIVGLLGGGCGRGDEQNGEDEFSHEHGMIYEGRRRCMKKSES